MPRAPALMKDRRGTALAPQAAKRLQMQVFALVRKVRPAQQDRFMRLVSDRDWHRVITMGLGWRESPRFELLRVLATTAQNTGDRNDLAHALLDAWPRIAMSSDLFEPVASCGLRIARALDPITQGEVDQVFSLPHKRAWVRAEIGRALAVEGRAPSEAALEMHMAWRKTRALSPPEARFHDGAIELMRARRLELTLAQDRPARQETATIPMGGL